LKSNLRFFVFLMKSWDDAILLLPEFSAKLFDILFPVDPFFREAALAA
jgi:hypothetical protein